MANTAGRESIHLKLYEGLFLIDPVQASTDWDKIINHIHDILTKAQAKIIQETKWGERKLAYAVKKQKRGTYYLVYFEAPPQKISQIKADCLLSEYLLRTLFLVAKRVPEIKEQKEQAK